MVDLKTPRQRHRVLHINRLKPHFERSELTMLLVTDGAEKEASEPLPDILSSKEKDGSVEGVILSSTLIPEQQGDCRQLLKLYSSLFSLTPGIIHLCTHDVDIGDNRPVKNKSYRLSDKVRASIKSEVFKMLKLGVIEASSSPWSRPVVLVPKAALPDTIRELRVCVDYRGLHSMTKTDPHPIPRADELIDRLRTAQYLSIIDITSGYWQITLTKGA